MTRRFTMLVPMIALMLAFSKPGAGQNGYIVRTTGGVSCVLDLCKLPQCQVQGGLGGPVGQNFLVTSSNNFLANLVDGALNLVESLLGIVSVEADSLLPTPQAPPARST